MFIGFCFPKASVAYKMRNQIMVFVKNEPLKFASDFMTGLSNLVMRSWTIRFQDYPLVAMYNKSDKFTIAYGLLEPDQVLGALDLGVEMRYGGQSLG